MATIEVLQDLETRFLPCKESIILDKEGNSFLEKSSVIRKISYYAENFFRAAFDSLLLPAAVSYDLVSVIKNKTYEYFHQVNNPIDLPKNLSEEEIASMLPKTLGFADSLFQSCALGSRYSKPEFEGRSNWDEWLTKEHIEIDQPEDVAFPSMFVNYLDNPDNLVNLLRSLNVTAYRFSLERSVIEPRKGEFDQNAIRKYQILCRKLKEAGIEPWMTLQHFVEPKWFTDAGGFENQENIENFVEYSQKIIFLFKDHVKNIMTFNEPSVHAFQTYVRKTYPSSGKKGIYLAAVVMRNLLIAHYKIYKKVKKDHPELNIGITHQWLNFKPHSGNIIERLVCYFLSKITHYAVYNFFKTGKFSLKIPGLANVNMQVEKDEKLTDFVGMQFYGYPYLKIGFNGGKTYPGYGIVNIKFPFVKQGLTFGATCKEEGGKTESFGVPYNPDSLIDALQEAEALKTPVAITETGCDAHIQHWGEKEFTRDEITQKEYYQRIYSIIAQAKLKLIGIFNWTLRGSDKESKNGHLEWERGQNVSLGVVSVSNDLKQSTLSEAARYIQSVFGKVQRQQAVA